jgi:hypothetical protein
MHMFFVKTEILVRNYFVQFMKMKKAKNLVFNIQLQLTLFSISIRANQKLIYQLNLNFSNH